MAATDPASRPDNRRRDDALIARVQSGDHAALEILFERHHRAVYGFLFRMTGSVPTGEDLTQEVFLRILRYSASFEPGREFRTWLFRIARNVLSDHRRRSAFPVGTMPLDGSVDEPAAVDPLPPEQLEKAEARAEVRQALARLNDADRELLILARFHELPHSELAELFDCNTGAIKVRVHRALKRLAAALSAQREEVGP